MPSERFLKLPAEKRQRILRAGFREFCQEPVSSASINNIIKEAEISRGSFYTYFEDKLDLLRYILAEGMREHEEILLHFLEESGGDLFECARLLYDSCSRELRATEKISFLKNIFADSGLLMELFHSGSASEKSEAQKCFSSFCKKAFERLDRQKYGVDEVHFLYALPMISMIAARGAAIAATCPEREEEVLRDVRYELDILKYGVLRREQKGLTE